MKSERKKRIELTTFENVLTQFDDKMRAKVDRLADAHREAREIGFDMLSLAGAIKGIAFARETLFDLIRAAGEAPKPDQSEEQQQELPTAKEG